MSDFVDQLKHYRVVPVIVVNDVDSGVRLGEALREGGLPLAEVTFRTPVAADAIREMARDSGLLVGAGTVLNSKDVDDAVSAGAQFVVSPGISESVISRCRELEIPILPGVATPTDMMTALAHGLDMVKFFPAEALGGASALKALAAPFAGRLQFVPTGGISVELAPSYLSHPAVLAVGGTWMVRSDLISEHRWDEIVSLTRQAVAVCSSA